MRGTQRRWLAYMREAADARARAAGDRRPRRDGARELVLDVIDNHHNLLRLPDCAGRHRGLTQQPERLDTAPESRRPPTSRPSELELRERARRFVDEVLIPNEELAERSGGQIPDELKQRIKREAIEARLSGGLHAPEHGGQGWSKTEWFLVEEQLGRSTNALSWHMPSAYNVLAERHARSRSSATSSPPCAASCTTPTRSPRREAGSDPSGIATTARATDGGWLHQRREVVRDLRRRRRGLHRDGQRDRGRRAAADAVPRRPRARRHRDRRRPALHAHLPARPPDRSASPTSRWPRTP